MRKFLLGLTFVAGALVSIPAAQAMPQLATAAISGPASVAPPGVETVQYYGRGERRREWRHREWRRRQAYRHGYRRY
jgi:hypothetical protein